MNGAMVRRTIFAAVPGVFECMQHASAMTIKCQTVSDVSGPDRVTRAIIRCNPQRALESPKGEVAGAGSGLRYHGVQVDVEGVKTAWMQMGRHAIHGHFASR